MGDTSSNGGTGGRDTRAETRRRARELASDALSYIEAVASGDGGRGAMARLAAAKALLEVAFDAKFEVPDDANRPKAQIVRLDGQDAAVLAQRRISARRVG